MVHYILVKIMGMKGTAYVINVFLLFVHDFGVHIYGLVWVGYFLYCCPSLVISDTTQKLP